MGIAPPVRVGIVSDDRLYAEGLTRILSTDSYIVLSDGSAEVLLLDARLEEALSMCGELAADGRAVILVGASDDDEFAHRALDAGARGVLLKITSAEDMLLAIRFVSAGVIWARRRVLSARIDQLAGRIVLRVNPFEERLSVREREVFREAVTGAGNKELAGRLAISEATVKVHLTRIFQKLGVRGRAELAAAYYGTAKRYDERSTPTR